MTQSFKEKNEELAKFWKIHIEQWVDKGISQRAYCRQHKLNPNQFTIFREGASSLGPGDIRPASQALPA